MTAAVDYPSSSALHKNWHILIVDDNRINQKIFTKYIEKYGYTTAFVASDGQEALDFIAETKITRGREKDGKLLDIIITDFHMDVMDGPTLTRRIRQLEIEGQIVKRIPVIGISSVYTSREIGKQTGMDEVLLNPISLRDLLEAINRHLPPIEEG